MTPPDQTNQGPRCRECGYDLQGLIDPDRCPECGTKITPSMLKPARDRDPDAGDAIERSGLGLIGASTWCSALLLCGLLLKPFVGVLIIMVFFLGSIARFLGWLRLHRGPLRRFDTTRFELFVRIATFIELGFLLLILVLMFGPWTIPMSVWWLTAGSGVVLGALCIAGPAIGSSLVGRQVEDPVLVGVGLVAAIASLIAAVASLSTMAMSFGIQARGTPATGMEGLIYSVLLGSTLLFTAGAAHFGRVAIVGTQSVLLEFFIEHSQDAIQGARVGGAWISARTGRRPAVPFKPLDDDPIPLSPRKPPRRPRGRSDAS